MAEGVASAAPQVGRQGAEGKLANLVRYPEGSNGGTRRGPDRFPRRNTIRAVFLQAMAQDQEREQIDSSTGKPVRGLDGQPVKAKVKFAMVQDIGMAYQLIAKHAAQGKDLDTFLRMMHDAHRMLQPAKDEAGEGRSPIPARFVYADQQSGAQPQAAAGKPAEGPRGGAIEFNGQVYE
jgi:hypothetical protein